jgi:Zn-dependent protease
MSWINGNVRVVHTDPMLIAVVPALITINIFWGFFNLLPVPPLDGGHAVRSFFRSILGEKPAFVISTWIAIVVGAVTVVVGLLVREFFLAVFIAFFVWRAIQQWQEFRSRGIIGD